MIFQELTVFPKITQKLRHISYVLAFAISICLTFSVHKAEAYYNSLLSWENSYFRLSEGESVATMALKILPTLWNCFAETPMYEYSSFSNSCLPNAIDINSDKALGCEGIERREGNNNSFLTNMIIGTIAFVAALVTLIVLFVANNPITWIGIIALITGYFSAFFALCQNVFVIAPYEYINYKLNTLKCGKNLFGKIENTYSRAKYSDPVAISDMEVPYFYDCPNYSASLEGELKTRRDDIDKAICSSKLGKDIIAARGTELKAGSVVFAIKSNALGSSRCAIQDAVHATGSLSDINLLNFNDAQLKTYYLTQEDINNIAKYGTRSSPTFTVRSFLGIPYKTSIAPYYDIIDGSVMVCIGLIPSDVPSMIPMTAGCGSIAPPQTNFRDDSYVGMLLKNTRCQYFMESRADLYFLGKSFYDAGQVDGSDQSVPKFLMSDLHFMSTTIGCFQDLLEKLLYVGADGNKSFLQSIFDGMRQAVLLVLSLYLTIIGIRILTSQQLQKAELFGYLLKIVFVALFALSDFWLPTSKIFYSDDMPKAERMGGYSFLIDGLMMKAADIFTQGMTAADPLRSCYFRASDGGNLLSSRLVPTTNYAFNTYNYRDPDAQYVKLTFVDLFECVVFNLLSLKTCQYNSDGLLMIWMPWTIIVSIVLTSLEFGAIAIFFALILTIIVILKIALKIMHLVFLSMIVITALVVLAPIMVSFIVFESTKEIFFAWLRTLIAYSFYPGFCLAFLGLFVVTTDSLFYGNIKEVMNQLERCRDQGQTCIQMDQICTADNESMYCTMYRQAKRDVKTGGVNINPCAKTPTESAAIVVERQRFPFATFGDNAGTKILDYIIGFDFLAWKGGAFNDSLIKMALITLLFYLMFDAIVAMIERMLGVDGPGGHAMGGISALGLYKLSGKSFKYQASMARIKFGLLKDIWNKPLSSTTNRSRSDKMKPLKRSAQIIGGKAKEAISLLKNIVSK